MSSGSHYRTSPPEAQGLYHPNQEHDSCGVGFIVNIKGEKSHQLVLDSLQILFRLTHRGACGCEENTGDGSGIVVQVPHKFLLKKCKELGIKLPEKAGEYGAGLVFMPQDLNERKQVKELFEKVVVEEGLTFLGWRELKRDNSALGATARRQEPHIEQIFIGEGPKGQTPETLELRLYVVRKRMEQLISTSDLKQKNYFYMPSLSAKTMVYKGLLLPSQILGYYSDLEDPDFESAIAMVHQRFSTNTFPAWDLAHPFRCIAHNGEINTVRGNQNWMRARETLFESPLFGDDIKKLSPIIPDGMSDSASFDCALELLHFTGRSLPHAVMMMIPAAWHGHESMPDEEKAFYEYHACLMEPWDGPASIGFTDGTVIGAVLDRNGLRPSRYTVTKDGFVIMASETGVLPVDPENVLEKGRLQPGRMFLVDTAEGRIIADEEIKSGFAKRNPYRKWLDEQQMRLDSLPEAEGIPLDMEHLRTHQRVFGYTLEDLKILLGPMAASGLEPIGSMGNDTPLAVLSARPQLLYSYFKQLFAQVTNPPLDAIREEIVTSLVTTIGGEEDLFDETPAHCHQLRLEQPILTNGDLAKIRKLDQGKLRACTISTLFEVSKDGSGLKAAMDRIRAEASAAIKNGYSILILSDRGVSKDLAPIPALLACSGVHQHLIREGTRTQCGLLVESGEPREVHHFALLFGYGAGGVNPYLAYETLAEICEMGVV
ncbi:MAG: glutamate synthase subunit alpha, partial [Planctomycetaceae bacterium]|nr:glutamate synthase subunit alpha [Planctomycetaceae bacterium]